MYSAIFLLQAGLQLGLFVWMIRVYQRTGLAALAVLFVPQLGLVWDNLIVGSGHWIGFGPTLEALSWPRFWIHWIMGSWLIIASGAILRLAGFAWAQKKWVMGAFCTLSVALTIKEIPLIWTTSLHPVCELDLIRYSTSVKPEDFCFPDQVAVASTGALAPIITCFVVIISGIFVWVRHKFPWMAICGTLMLISATPPMRPWKLDNLGEVLIVFGVVLAIDRLASSRRESLARRHALAPSPGS